jgi:hypothetical protein
MKKLIIVTVLLLLGATLAPAHPFFYPPGPTFGFQIVASSPQVGVYLYWGEPIYVGPACPPDGWGYYGPPHHRYWGWYHNGYFNCWNHDGRNDWNEWNDRWRHDGYEHRWDGDEGRDYDRRGGHQDGDWQGNHDSRDDNGHKSNGNHSSHGKHGNNGHNGHRNNHR